jgi:hypothetical protein
VEGEVINVEIPPYSVIGFVFALAIMLVDFYLLRKRRIGGRGFLLWLAIGIGIGIAFIAPAVFFSPLVSLFGAEYWLSGVTGAAFMFFLAMTFYLYVMTYYFHSRISELHDMLMKLTMEFSVRKRAEEQEEVKKAN